MTTRQCSKVYTTRNGKTVSAEVESCDDVTFETVAAYIKKMIKEGQELTTKINSEKLGSIISEYSKIFSGNKTITPTIKSENFNVNNESNPFSYIVSMYELSKVTDDEHARLSAVHDGWAIARLMNLNMQGELSFGEYKTNRIDTTKEQLVIDFNIDNLPNLTSTSIKDYIILDYLVKLGKHDKKNAIFTHLDGKPSTNILVNLQFTIEGKLYSSTIRGNQLCMFVPFNMLGEEIQNDDVPYLQEYIKKEGEQFKYKIISDIIDSPSAGTQAGGRPRRGGSACSHTPSQKRVLIGGKPRVVYQGKRGGEYIKKGGEFISLSKVLKAISTK
jgi:hypothetical protein